MCIMRAHRDSIKHCDVRKLQVIINTGTYAKLQFNSTQLNMYLVTCRLNSANVRYKTCTRTQTQHKKYNINTQKGTTRKKTTNVATVRQQQYV